MHLYSPSSLTTYSGLKFFLYLLQALLKEKVQGQE